jgi:Flp pilus assembly protein TadG
MAPRALLGRDWRDDGAAAVEFALVIIPLLLLVGGIINFGVLFTEQLALNNGVRQGTRAAVVAGNSTAQSCGEIIAGTQSASGPSLGMDTSQISVKITRVSTTDPSVVTSTACGTSFVIASGDTTTRPCVGSFNTSTGTTDSLKVEAQYPASFFFFPSSAATITLHATAVYRCEFS